MSSITVGVYLGKKDRIVRYWYEILPKGQFPMLVKYCLQSYLCRKKFFPLHTICDPRSLKEQTDKRSEYVPTQRNVTFCKEDGSTYYWVVNIGSGYRSEAIKSILRETVVSTLLNCKVSYPQQRGVVPPVFGVDAPVFGVDPRGNPGIPYGPGSNGNFVPEDAAGASNIVVPGMDVVSNSIHEHGEDNNYRAWGDKLPEGVDASPSMREDEDMKVSDDVSDMSKSRKPVYPMSLG